MKFKCRTSEQHQLRDCGWGCQLSVHREIPAPHCNGIYTEKNDLKLKIK